MRVTCSLLLVEPPKVWIDDLSRRLGEGRVAFVCGTGVSMALAEPSNVITWKGLISDGLTHLVASDASLQPEADLLWKMLEQARPNATTFLTVANWVKSHFEEFRDGEYRAWLRAGVGSLKLRADAPTFLTSTRSPLLTSNYDGLLGELCHRKPIEWTDKGHLDQYFDDPSQYVYHLHGHWDSPNSVVLSSADYQRLSQAPSIARVFEALGGSYTFVFLGYGAGIEDPNYSRFLDWFGLNFQETCRSAYALCRDAEIPTPGMSAAGLRYMAYGEDYADLWGFLENLTPTPSPARPNLDAPTGDKDIGADEDGIEGLLAVLAGLPTHVRAEVESQLGDPTRWGEFQRRVLVTEHDLVRVGGGALVAGVTGTGKTTVSRTAMNLSVAGNSAAVMLVPTKALVAQEMTEWDAWVNAWRDDTKQIRVYPASRDYPESDAPVSRGRFDIAVAIYEKFAGYLAAGHPSLDATSLVVIDELQTLVDDDERARKLEGLLTMIRLLPTDRRPAIVGLSATLSEASTDSLRAWLEIPAEHFLSSVNRPIPLDTYVLDSSRVRKQADAHLLSLGDTSLELPAAREEEHRLVAGESYARLGVKGLGNAPIGISLIIKLIKEDPSRRVIAFVPGRTAAEEIALAIQRELDIQMGQVRRKGNPWLFGRFASGAVSEEDTRKYDALRYSDIPMWDHALRALRTGVAYHTARLPANLRRLLEQEFRSQHGALRVIVATDTLAQGVNLPADAVVCFSITTYGSGRRPLLSTPAQLDNKAGRAGRRGLAARERGEVYILVPTERDLQDVSNLTAPGVKRLATVEGVFEHFVVGTAGTPRTSKVSGHIRSLDEVSLLALQVLCADGYGRSAEKLEARVETVVRNLLSFQEDGTHLPTAAAVVARLRDLKLLTPDVEEKTRLTRLGSALGRSALSLQSAYVLEQLGRLAIAGAGDIDILFNAFRSPEIEEVSAWVGMPAVEARHKPSMKDKLTTYATAYCGLTLERRQYCALYFGSDRHALVQEWVREGQHVISHELKGLLDRDVENIDDRDATALLRALVAFEWSRGVPFDEIKARITSAITSDEDQRGRRPVEIKIHYSDVEQLCEQVAGVIRGAAAVSFSESHDWSLRISGLALRVEVGLPSWLAPIARLRHPLLHRNRLARLWRATPTHERLSEILDMDELRGAPGITDDQREELRALLDRREFEEALHRHRVAQVWASELVPGLEGETFEEFGEELENAVSPSAYAAILTELATALDISSQPVNSCDGFVGVRWAATGQSVILTIPGLELGSDEVEAVGAIDTLVILRTRLRPSARTRLAMRPTTARFVRPEVLLEVIAKLAAARGSALDPGEAVERLSQLRVSVLDAEDVNLSIDSPAGPPPFVGPAPTLPAGRAIEFASEDYAD